MEERTEKAVDLMERFAARTGLAGDRPQRRYLWTDAFAVCNLLGLERATGERRFRSLALRLIDDVHAVLGRHREDDGRSGWLSGLNDEQAARHPTRAGLRIGKPFPERPPGELVDPRSEWERDGQYFHYLTKWMHALDQTTRATGDWTFNRWGRELADAAFQAFTYRVEGTDRRRMHWKMSIDLSRPLVEAMGQHDPLDGYVTYAQLQSTARDAPLPLRDPPVGDEADALAAAIARETLRTADPLGLGGLLFDAARIAQLRREGAFRAGTLVELLLAAALDGLEQYESEQLLRLPAEQRLPFRELGLALGLRGTEVISGSGYGEELRRYLAPLFGYLPMAVEIETFWRDEEHWSTRTWTGHCDINEVMLATLLQPAGMLLLREPPGA